MGIREKAMNGVLYEQAVENVGIYAQSVKGGKNPYEKRTEAMEAHNKVIMNITHDVSTMDEFIRSHGLCRYIENALLNERIHMRIKKDDDVEFFVVCNDLFYWAYADLEFIKPEEIEELDGCFKESPGFGGELWVARKRGMRPQQPYYEYFSDEDKILFNACGPERDPKDEG